MADTQSKELVHFNCAICGINWTSKVKRAGKRLCVDCVELRRSINSFINKGLDAETVRDRVNLIIDEA